MAWLGVAIVGCGLLGLLFPVDFGLHRHAVGMAV